MRLSLRNKIIGLACLAALLPVLLVFIVTPGLESRLEEQLSVELDDLAKNNVGQITKDMYRMCETVHQLMVQRAARARAAAGVVLEDAGGASLLQQRSVSWNAVTKAAGRNRTLQLPGLAVGGEWIGKQTRLVQTSPVVDKVKRLTKTDCSLYQRINESGDMLRVATTLTDSRGRRAIGAIIPARYANGTRNPVIQPILQTRSHHQDALGDMQNVLKDYEPVVSPTGDVIGMIEVSVRLNAMEQIHETLMQVQVGETGYVWALGGQGRDRGVYIVSKDGARDGENIYNATDADGEHFVRKIVNTALEKGSSPGAVSFMTYQWKNPGDEHPRTKLSAYVYFAPWDWIIGAGVYMDDYHDARRDMHKAMTGYTGKIITSSAVILVLMVGLAFFLGRRMADPIGRMVAIAQDVAGCDVDAAGRRLDELATRRPSLARAADSEEASAKVDETGQLFAAMQSMISNLDSLVGQVQRSGVQVTTSSTEIAASARQMESTMEHHRENTAEISSAANEISATSRELLQTVQAVLESTNQTADLAAKGRQSLNQMASIMGELSGSTDSISGKLSDLFDKANDVVSIISTITKVADQTNLLSLNASIEAEKAGDYGLGFAVVAREIRRLADQTGVAALDIEKKVNEMLEAVKEGASEMERFTSDVKNGAEKTHKIGGSLEEIMQRVQDLQPQLEDVNDGVRVQSEGADQISNNMLELSDAAKHTAEAVKEFNRAATQLNQAVQALQAEVNRFKVSE